MVTVVVEPVAGVDVVTRRSFRCQLHNQNTFWIYEMLGLLCGQSDSIKWGHD